MINFVDNEKLIIKTNAAVRIGDEIFFSHSRINALIKIDLIQKLSTFVAKFPDASADEFLHMGALAVNNKLYFIPNKAKCVHEYDISENTIKVIATMDTIVSGVVLNEKDIWLIPFDSKDSLLVIDSANDEVSLNDRWKNLWDVDEIFDSNGIIDDGDNIILIPFSRNYYYVLDKKSYHLEKIIIKKECRVRAGIKNDDKLVLSTADNNDILVCDFEGNVHLIVDDMTNNNKDQYFTYMIKSGQGFWTMPEGEQYMVWLDNNFEKYSDGKKLEIHNSDWRMPYKCSFDFKNDTIYLPFFADEIVIYNEKESKQLLLSSLKVVDGLDELYLSDLEVARKRVKEKFVENSIIKEDCEFNLGVLLKNL